MFGKKDIKVNAILEDDLESLLKSTKQYEEVVLGNVRCISCGTIITTENIGIIIPDNSEANIKLKFYCERIDCAEDYKLKSELDGNH